MRLSSSGMQDTELRYRFIHNAFPTLTEEVCNLASSFLIFRFFELALQTHNSDEILRASVILAVSLKFLICL